MASTEIQKFEYYDFNGGVEILYLGSASFGVGEGDPKWVLKKFTHAIDDNGNTIVTLIQTLSGKSWTDRASYDWS